MTSDLALQFDRDGYLVCREVVSADDCAGLLQEVLVALSGQGWSYIHEGEYRAHCPLPLTPRLARTVRTALHATYHVVDGFLTRRRFLVELSSITVFPNAKRQREHADELDPSGNLVTAFVNLFPTASGVAPLLVLPGSHRAGVQRREPIPLLLPAGSVVLMNGKLRHLGGENSSLDRIRPVVYFSFGDDDLDGPTYSMRGEYRRRFELADFQPAVPTVDCRPHLASKCWVASDLAVSSDRLIVMRGALAQETLELGDDRRWLLKVLGLIGRQPGVHTVAGLARSAGVSDTELLAAIAKLRDIGLVDWARSSSSPLAPSEIDEQCAE